MSRTLSGLQSGEFDEVDIFHSLTINGDGGQENYVVASNGDNTIDWKAVGTLIPNNSITNQQIAPNTITSTEIAPNTITNQQIAPNTITVAEIAGMPTLTIQKNSVSVGTYNPKTDNDTTINVAVPVESIQGTPQGAIVVANVGAQYSISISFDGATIIKNGSDQLEVGAVPFAKLTIGDGDIGYPKLTLNDQIKNADVSTNAAIAITKLASSTISGKSLGSNLADLTAGSHIAFSSGTTYNGGTALTISATNTLPASGNNISITGAGGNVVNLDFTSGGDIGFSNLAASPTNIFATNIKPTNLEVSNNAVFKGGISLNAGAGGGLQNIADVFTINCNILEAATQIQSPLIKVGNTRGDEVIMYRTAFTIETEWFSDVFPPGSGGSNDSFVNSCWFFGNKEEYTLTPTNWKIYAAGSGNGKSGGFNTYPHAKNDIVGTGSNAILYSKSFMDLSSITKITYHVIKGNDMNGGQSTTSYDDLFLIWNNGVGGTGFQTFPTTSSAAAGDYHFKLLDGGDSVATSWTNQTLDLSAVLTATGLTNFNNANRVAFYSTDTNGQYGISNIQFKGLSKPVDKKNR
jgi:hypothetical protein